MKWRSRWRSRESRLRLWPIQVVLPLAFVLVAAGLGGLAWAARAWLHYPALPHPRSLSLHDWVGVLQLVFASVAGAGALVALIVAYRRQRVAEADSAHDRIRVFNERFIAIAGQLGNSQAALRLAGVHAMAGLADDWEENRQTCIDVLCAYLRMPYEPDPGIHASAAERLAFGASREVRHTVIRIVTAHLRESAAEPWLGLNFDFTGVVFDGGSFSNAEFSGGIVDFGYADFSYGFVDFSAAQFSGGTVDFSGARFSGGTVDFSGAKFSGSTVRFSGNEFSGSAVDFTGAEFSGGRVDFTDAEFSGGTVDFSFRGAEFSSVRGGSAVAVMSSAGVIRFGFRTQFSGGTVDFGSAKFSGGTVDFGSAEFSGGTVDFSGAHFSGSTVDFDGAQFSGSAVHFGGSEEISSVRKFRGGTSKLTFRHSGAQFSSGSVDFGSAVFSGGTIDFGSAVFSGGTVDFSQTSCGSSPPTFGFTGTPPAGVQLPQNWTP